MEPYRVNILFVGTQGWKISAENEFFLAMEKLCGMETWNCRRVRFKRQYADRSIVIGGRGKCLPEKRIEFISEALNGRLSGDEERIWRNKFDLLIIVADANAIVNKNVGGAEMRSIIATCRFAMHNARSGDDELLVLKMPKEICRLQDKCVEGMRLRIALAKALCGKEDNIVGVSKWFVDAWNSISPLEYLAQYKDRLFTNSGKRVPFFPSLMFLLEDSLAPGYIEILSEIIDRCYKKEKLQLNLNNGIFNLNKNKVMFKKVKTIRLAVVGFPTTGKTFFLQDVYGAITRNLGYIGHNTTGGTTVNFSQIWNRTYEIGGGVSKTDSLDSRILYYQEYDNPRLNSRIFKPFKIYTMNIAGEHLKNVEEIGDIKTKLNEDGKNIVLKIDNGNKRIEQVIDKRDKKSPKEYILEREDCNEKKSWPCLRQEVGNNGLFSKKFTLQEAVKTKKIEFDLEELSAIVYYILLGKENEDDKFLTRIKNYLFLLRATDVVMCDRIYMETTSVDEIYPLGEIRERLDEFINEKGYVCSDSKIYYVYRGADGIISQKWLRARWNINEDESLMYKCDRIYERFLESIYKHFSDRTTEIMEMKVDGNVYIDTERNKSYCVVPFGDNGNDGGERGVFGLLDVRLNTGYLKSREAMRANEMGRNDGLFLCSSPILSTNDGRICSLRYSDVGGKDVKNQMDELVANLVKEKIKGLESKFRIDDNNTYSKKKVEEVLKDCINDESIKKRLIDRIYCIKGCELVDKIIDGFNIDNEKVYSIKDVKDMLIEKGVKGNEINNMIRELCESVVFDGDRLKDKLGLEEIDNTKQYSKEDLDKILAENGKIEASIKNGIDEIKCLTGYDIVDKLGLKLRKRIGIDEARTYSKEDIDKIMEEKDIDEDYIIDVVDKIYLVSWSVVKKELEEQLTQKKRDDFGIDDTKLYSREELNTILSENGVEEYHIKNMIKELYKGNCFSDDLVSTRMRFGTQQFVVCMLYKHDLVSGYDYRGNTNLEYIITGTNQQQ